MMTLSMLSTIASIINCLFISCEIVMPTSLKCCTLSTIISLVFMKCLSSFCLGWPRSATAEGMSACEFAVNRRAGFLSRWYRPHTYGLQLTSEGEKSTDGGETSTVGGETSWWRNIQGAKRPVKGRNVQGAKHQWGETSVNQHNSYAFSQVHCGTSVTGRGPLKSSKRVWGGL